MVRWKEFCVLGCALFAMFFGAGNLIFPPSLGIHTGVNWFIASIGFLMTGVGLPLLGILAFVRCEELNNFASKVSPLFNTIFCSILILVLGPLFAIPRTGSTTFELAILPLLDGNSNALIVIITSFVFFTCTLLLTIRPNKITDIIGKCLTPIILSILGLIFIRGLFIDLGTPITTSITKNIFAYGFINGYQTMDALASILFGVVIIKSLELKGISDKKEQSSYLIYSGIIAAIGLGIIYMFLIYFGSLISNVQLTTTTSSAVYIAEQTIGSMGRIIFGICVGISCLTTAVGLTALTADWFSKLTNISYEKLVVAICIFSSIIAMFGVDKIITLSVPILLFLYPITIVLIILNIFNMSANSFKFATYITTCIVSIEFLATTFNVPVLQNFINKIPLGSDGFVWLVPFILSLIIAYFIDILQGKKNKITD